MDVRVDRPRVLALLDAQLMPNDLLSQAQIISLLMEAGSALVFLGNAWRGANRSTRSRLAGTCPYAGLNAEAGCSR